MRWTACKPCPVWAGFQSLSLCHTARLGNAGNDIRHAPTRKNVQEVGYFRCHGVDYFLPYLKQGYLFSPDLLQVYIGRGVIPITPLRNRAS